jgi:hypothetical protein
MVKADIPKAVGGYLSEVMQVELTHFLGRQPYERVEEGTNHRKSSYPRNFTLEGHRRSWGESTPGPEREISDTGHFQE